MKNGLRAKRKKGSNMALGENEFKGQKRSKGSSFGAIPFLRKMERARVFEWGDL